jgi:vacuolar-type H+-ATPase subunit F/Vma7
MKKVAFLTPPDVKYGFSLTGIAQHVVEVDEAENMLKKIMGEGDNGLIVIEERLLAGLPEDRIRELEQAWNGILLVLPSPVKPPSEVEDYAARLIRRAIGYHVRLKI